MKKGTPWLVFGSFWNGIKLVKLNKDMKSVAQPEQWYTVASRQRNFILPDSVAGDAAIEGPFIFKKIITITSLFHLIIVAVAKRVPIKWWQDVRKRGRPL
jgi:hypothetical protein